MDVLDCCLAAAEKFPKDYEKCTQVEGHTPTATGALVMFCKQGTSKQKNLLIQQLTLCCLSSVPHRIITEALTLCIALACRPSKKLWTRRQAGPGTWWPGRTSHTMSHTRYEAFLAPPSPPAWPSPSAHAAYKTPPPFQLALHAILIAFLCPMGPHLYPHPPHPLVQRK